MGGVWRGKALTPTHYGETLDKPKRTHCLLRAWSLWRARQFGFAADDFRARQWAKDHESLVDEILLADGREEVRAPIFKSKKAQKLLRTWAPDALALAMARAG